jgi:hypothetical protein
VYTLFPAFLVGGAFCMLRTSILTHRNQNDVVVPRAGKRPNPWMKDSMRSPNALGRTRWVLFEIPTSVVQSTMVDLLPPAAGTNRTYHTAILSVVKFGISGIRIYLEKQALQIRWVSPTERRQSREPPSSLHRSILSYA